MPTIWTAVSVPASRVGTITAACGTAIVVITTLLFGSFGAGLVGFAVWALLPYVVLFLAGRVTSSTWTIAGAGALALAIECGVRASVFLFPRGSTAAIALVFSPALITVIGLPAGAIGGHVAGRFWRRGGIVLKAAIAAMSAAVLVLVFVQLAAPDFFPTAIFRRRATLARVGEPRMLVGASTFTVKPIWPRPAWFLTGRFTDAQGDSIAIVDSDLQLLDPDGVARERVPLSMEARRRWGWDATLVRIGGRLLVAQTGGGYQDTEVHDLDGRLLWRYRPDANLPPTTMKPADLDGDGRPEFYASSTNAIARLDENGQEVWRRPLSLGSLVAALAKEGRRPAWVVTYNAGGRAAVWSDAGEALGEIRLSSDSRALGAGDWRNDRVLLAGGTTLRTITLDGREQFSYTLPDFTFNGAAVVRLRADAPPYLAAIAAAPRDVGRWRVLVFSADGRIVFDEIAGAPVRLLTARRADGSEALLLATDRLRLLQPV